MLYYHIIAGCQNLGTATPKNENTVLTVSTEVVNNLKQLKEIFRTRFYSHDFSKPASYYEDDIPEIRAAREQYIKQILEKIKTSEKQLIDCSHLSYNMNCCRMFVYVTENTEVYLTRSEMKMIFPHD